jgi:TRAP-type C4-dicarboxylate transport system permease small subunit
VIELNKAFSYLEKFLSFLIVLLLSFMVLFIFSQVVARFILNMPLSWTEEISRHIMIWMAFIATSVAYRHGAHLSIDLLATSINPKARLVLRIFFLLIIIAFLTFMVKYGIELTQRTVNQRSSSLQYSMSYVYLAVPTSGIIMIIFSIEKIINLLKRKEGDEQ